jgi:microcystin-dependent protein
MPSASGVYSLPPGYLAVTGTTIEASQHNPPLEDIAQALTLRLSRDGSAPMTGGLKGIAGTAALPSYVFATDASSGLFKTTNGIGVSVAGTQVAEFTSAGMASGVRLLGEIIAWSRVTCPPLFVFPAGQTLSRTTYAALWPQAQIEIAAGNLFFNNGDGSTTFGIGDLRGRTIAAPDSMGGGTDPNRLTSGALAGVRNSVGGAGGESAHALSAGELPAITTTTNATFSQSVTSTVSNVVQGSPVTQNLQAGGNPIGAFTNGAASSSAVTSTGTIPRIPATSDNTQVGSTGAPHNVMQPTLLCNWIMFAGA